MKKILIITTICCFTAIPNIFGQDSSRHIHGKKQYSAFLKIETIGGNSIEAALDRLTIDSVFLAHVEDNYVRAGGKQIKILKSGSDGAIAVSQIRKFQIKYDPNIIATDQLEKRKKELKSKNAGRIVGITFATAATIALIPFAILTGGLIDPTWPLQIALSGTGPGHVSVSGDNLYITNSYRTF